MDTHTMSILEPRSEHGRG